MADLREDGVLVHEYTMRCVEKPRAKRVDAGEVQHEVRVRGDGADPVGGPAVPGSGVCVVIRPAFAEIESLEQRGGESEAVRGVRVDRPPDGVDT